MDMNLHATKILAAEASFASLGFVQLDSKRALGPELGELRTLLHQAMVLEHATIPPYLTLLYTMCDDVEWRAIDAVRSIVIEEMLHFTLAANVLNAIGGTPAVNGADFMAGYPARLPLGVDGIEVHLLGFSREGMRQGLMIEHPKDIRPARVLREDPSQMTIGEFYAYIGSRLRAAVEQHGEAAIFCGDRSRQIEPHMFYYGGGGDLVQVHGLDDALRAMRTITDQGEGSRGSVWVEDEHEVAHYFKFSELYNEQLYRAGDTVDSGPTGARIDVAWDKAVPVRGEARLRDYPPGEVRDAIAAFNRRYSALLADLQLALSGQPNKLMPAVVAMCALRDDFRAITANPFPGDPRAHSLPTFEYPAVRLLQATAATAVTDGNAQTLARMQQGYSTGNLDLLLSCLAEQVIWDIAGPSECPYFGVFYGHDGFARFWRLLGDTVNFDSAGTEQIFIEDKQAMCYGGEQGTTKSGRVPYRYDWAVRYHFNEQHQITLMRQYFNPLNILSALKAAPYPVPATAAPLAATT